MDSKPTNVYFVIRILFHQITKLVDNPEKNHLNILIGRLKWITLSNLNVLPGTRLTFLWNDKAPEHKLRLIKCLENIFIIKVFTKDSLNYRSICKLILKTNFSYKI